MRTRRQTLGLVVLTSLIISLSAARPTRVRAADTASPAFVLKSDADGATLQAADGQPILRYVTRKPSGVPLSANSACFLHPVYSPAGQVITDLAPDDHRHHRGVFLGWFAMHGLKDADFWGWGKFAPTDNRRIENRNVRLISADAESATLHVRNEWLAEDLVLIDEFLTITAHAAVDGARAIDYVTRLTPRSDITIDASAFGGFCVRSRKDGTFAIFDATGEVKRPDPHYLKPETDWPAAAWYAFTLKPDGGRNIGLALIDAPNNPTSLWHNNRAVYMLNPCITAGGPVKMKKGEPLELRYRLVAFDNDLPARRIEALAHEWRHTYGVRYIKNLNITLDGTPDESAWHQANVQRQFAFPWKKEPAPPTEFRALCDDRYLYLAYTVKDSDLVVSKRFTDELDSVFEDRAEIYLGTDGEMKKYYCAEIDPKGRRLDYKAAFPRNFDMKWNFETLETMGAINPDGYTVEARISWTELDRLGIGRMKVGSALRAGLFRAEFSHDRSGTPRPPIDPKHTQGRTPEGDPPIEEWISWVDPQMKDPDFHVPRSLGWLRIEE